jgi:type I restriction enzyme S subunit
VGFAKYIADLPAPAVFASYLVRFRVRETVDARYVGYVVQSTAYKEFVRAQAGGSAQPNANARILGSFPVAVPDIVTQRRVAGLMSAFDELIEINNRRIELLENLARSLYREWFVRFRFPGHEHADFVDSDLGSIPDGWTTSQLRHLVAVQYGLTASTSHFAVGPKFLRGMDINKRSFIDWSAVPYSDAAESDVQKFRLEVGDVCVVRMADPGKVGIVETPVDAVFASYLVRLRSLDIRLNPYLLFHHLDAPEYQDWVKGSSTGATRKSASAKVLTEPSVLLPSEEVRKAFEARVGTFRRRLAQLVEANSRLATTRDLLLPRLVKGRLELSEVDLGDLLPAEVP